jgi:hypothetical protein
MKGVAAQAPQPQVTEIMMNNESIIYKAMPKREMIGRKDSKVPPISLHHARSNRVVADIQQCHERLAFPRSWVAFLSREAILLISSKASQTLCIIEAAANKPTWILALLTTVSHCACACMRGVAIRPPLVQSKLRMDQSAI